MQNIHLTSKIARNPTAAFTAVDDEIIIMSPEDHVYYRLNSVGALIWSLLESNDMSLEQMVIYIKNHYQIEIERAFQGVKAFIEKMLSQKILICGERP